MTEQQRSNDSQPQTSTFTAATTNHIPAGYQAVYHNGRELLVRDEDKAALEAELGLIPEKHDVEKAVTAFNTHLQAIGPTFSNTLAEMLALGWVREEADSVMHQAIGDLLNAWEFLKRSVGGTMPTEAGIRTIAEHKALHGNLDAVEHLKRYEGLADAYAAGHPIDAEALQARARQDDRNAVAALIARAAEMAESDPDLAAQLREQAQKLGSQS
jgi:hypothetical protein